jgi:hypothetical protein
MEEYLIRFIAGGTAVSAFAALGNAFRPKSFAGLFGAAPSIAVATLLIALFKDGPNYAAVEGRSMMVGAGALAAYCVTVCQLLKRYELSGLSSTLLALFPWFVVAFGLCRLLLIGS